MLDDLAHYWRCTPQAVFLVACQNRGERAVMTASSVTSASFEPPTVAVFINKKASIHKLITEVDARFTVSRLAQSQIALANSCAGSEDSEERFDEQAWSESDDYLLPNGAGGILCATVSEFHHLGSHTIVVGRIQRVVRNNDETLLYHQGDYVRN